MESFLHLSNLQIEGVIVGISNIIFALISSCIDFYLFFSLFKVKCTKKEIIRFIILNAISELFMLHIFPVIYTRLLDTMSTIIFFKLCFKNASIEKCILAETINTMTIIGPEIITAKILNSLYDETYIVGINNKKYFALVLFSIIIFRLIFLYFVKRKNIVINIGSDISNKNRTTIIVIAIIGYVKLFLNLMELTTINTNLLYVIYLLQFSTLLLCFYVSVANIIKIIQLEEQNIKIISLESHNKVLSGMYDDIRGFKHDFSNFVQSLDGYTKTYNIDGIREMSKGVLKDCIATSNQEILDPNIINDSGIYNLITNKFYLAQQKGITMNIEVMIDFKDIDITNYELCRILAILLDNAIEAASECDTNKVVNVKFLRDLMVDRKLVIVENSYKDDNLDIDRIFEKGFSTKQKKDEKVRGIGLWNIRKILNNNRNLNLYTTKGELFSQQLEVYSIRIKESI